MPCKAMARKTSLSNAQIILLSYLRQIAESEALLLPYFSCMKSLRNVDIERS